MLLEMSRKARQLLCQEVFEDSLIYLKLTKKKTMNYLLKSVLVLKERNNAAGQ